MSMRNYFKKLGKRIAGSWGRVNHPKQMRQASKGVRKSKIDMEDLRIPIDAIQPINMEDITIQQLFDEEFQDDIVYDDPRDYH